MQTKKTNTKKIETKKPQQPDKKPGLLSGLLKPNQRFITEAQKKLAAVKETQAKSRGLENSLKKHSKTLKTPRSQKKFESIMSNQINRLSRQEERQYDSYTNLIYSKVQPEQLVKALDKSGNIDSSQFLNSLKKEDAK